MNDFNLDLEWSLNTGTDKTLNDLYHRAFPHLREIIAVKDLKLQIAGIDKILLMDCGKKVLVDEKIRRSDYGDILLEEYSDFDRKKVGWIGRTKFTDYIVYYVVPTKKVYLLPFLILQKAWLANYQDWLKLFGRKFAQNKNYKTSNIPVPVEELLAAIKTEICADTL